MSCCDCDFCEELPDGRLLCVLYDEIVGHSEICDEYQSETRSIDGDLWEVD